ncbi:MAG: adenylate/guanylate cyclase domain-containing protein [Planctomycetota bacterium]
MLEVAVFNNAQHIQQSIDEKNFTIGSGEDNLIVIDDEGVSEFQCRIELIDSKSIRITNLGGSMVLGNNSRLHHLVVSKQKLPCCLEAGETHIQFCSQNLKSRIDHSIRQLPNIGSSSLVEVSEQKTNNDISPSPETLSSWFEALSQVQRSTAGQKAFFKLAARCVFNPGGLDGCIILMNQDNRWSVVAQHLPYAESGICYRKDLVDVAVEKKQPIFHDSALIKESKKQGDMHAAVVCPVLDGHQDVKAVVYGFRCVNRNNYRKGIRRLEAKFVSLVTDAISAGLIRLEHEADRARKRVLLEQAFSPEVAEQLEANPDILKGQERDITVLFADLRGFCRISESVGPSVTYQLLTDVMDRFTQVVHEHEGVIIDFYGDGMSAFWNAPVDQPFHQVLACKAAMAIDAAMYELNREWSTDIGQRMRVGIGVHSGIAQVGNSGSRNRLKYGPQGNTVNLASRLEKCTKKLGVNVVVTEAIVEHIVDHFIPRRICTAQLPGIGKPVSLYKLVEPIEFSKMSKYYESYQQGLELYEAGNYLDALELLSSLASEERPLNHPMLEFLLKEITDHLKVKHQGHMLADEQKTAPYLVAF